MRPFWYDCSSGNDEFHPFANAHVELFHLILREHHEKSARWVRSRGNKDVFQRLVGLVPDLSSGAAREKADSVDAFSGKLNQYDLLKDRSILCAECLDDLLNGGVDRVDDG